MWTQLRAVFAFCCYSKTPVTDCVLGRVLEGSRATECICIIKGDCSGDLHERSWVVQQWPHTTEHCSGSVLEAGRCLSSPSLARKAWKIPGKMLAFGPHWKPKLESAGGSSNRQGQIRSLREKQSLLSSYLCVWDSHGRCLPHCESLLSVNPS